MALLIPQSEGVVIAGGLRKIQRTSRCIITVSGCKKSFYIFSLVVISSLARHRRILDLGAYCENNVIQKKHTIKGDAF